MKPAPSSVEWTGKKGMEEYFWGMIS